MTESGLGSRLEKEEERRVNSRPEIPKNQCRKLDLVMLGVCLGTLRTEIPGRVGDNYGKIGMVEGLAGLYKERGPKSSSNKLELEPPQITIFCPNANSNAASAPTASQQIDLHSTH